MLSNKQKPCFQEKKITFLKNLLYMLGVKVIALLRDARYHIRQNISERKFW